MKTTISKILVFLFITSFIAFSSCTKDNDKDPANNLNYDNATYNLTWGIIAKPVIVKKSHALSFPFVIAMASSGLSWDAQEDDFIGSGHIVYFFAFSSSMTDLDNGTYNFSNSGEAFTFGEGGVMIHWDIENETGLEDYINSGSFTLSKSGSTYSITINCGTEDQKTVTGFYKGPLTEISLDLAVMSNHR